MKKSIVIFLLLITSTAFANPFGGMIASGGVLSPYRLTWDCDDLTAEIYDPDDGGTFTVSSGSVSYVSGVTGNAIQFASLSYGYFVATDGNNIDWGNFEIEFDYQYVSGTPSSVTYIVSSPYASTFPYCVRGSSTGNTTLVATVVGTSYISTVTQNIFDGAWHHIKIILNCSGLSHQLVIDGSTYSSTLSSSTEPAPATQRVMLNGFNSTTSAQVVNYDNFKIK